MNWENILKTNDAGFTGFNRPKDVEEPNEEREYTLEDADAAEKAGVPITFVKETEEIFKGAMERVGAEKLTIAMAKKLRALYDMWDELDDEQITSLIGAIQLGWSFPNNVYFPFRQVVHEQDLLEEEENSRKRRNQRILASIRDMENDTHLEEDHRNQVIEALKRRLT
tara:strand:- start:948 stop:1451 length:504 start_codon:yes stop_codon:yes gene_type:complete